MIVRKEFPEIEELLYVEAKIRRLRESSSLDLEKQFLMTSIYEILQTPSSLNNSDKYQV